MLRAGTMVRSETERCKVIGAPVNRIKQVLTARANARVARQRLALAGLAKAGGRSQWPIH